MEFRKARVEEILDDPRYDPSNYAEMRDILLGQNGKWIKIPQKNVTNKENGDKKAEKEKLTCFSEING